MVNFQSLHIDQSTVWPLRKRLADFPHHSLLFQYFNDYVDHFGLRDNIDAIAMRIISGMSLPAMARPANMERWWLPMGILNMGDFAGIQMHSHDYDSPFEPYDLRGKNVLVVGVGNSAMDIASEISQRPIAGKCFFAVFGCWKI